MASTWVHISRATFADARQKKIIHAKQRPFVSKVKKTNASLDTFLQVVSSEKCRVNAYPIRDNVGTEDRQRIDSILRLTRTGSALHKARWHRTFSFATLTFSCTSLCFSFLIHSCAFSFPFLDAFRPIFLHFTSAFIFHLLLERLERLLED